jgi:nicotinate-nucleotide adenylyltransferase
VTRDARRPRRIGVFGGTFDPPHAGHLALAERARDELGLARVLFVPAADPPHKRAYTPLAHRLAMARLAVRGFPAFAVSDLEARRAGPSYTVDTLRELHRRHPAAELWLLLGEDSLRDLPAWRDPSAIATLARIAVAPRPGVHARPRAGTRVTWLSAPALDIASHDLRARARRGESLRVLVPDPVIAYARRHRLYAARMPAARPRTARAVGAQA